MASTSKPSEPIAIVGSGCRFAGNVSSPSKLWELLSHPPDLSREVPAERFSAKGFYHKDGEYHGTTDSTKAYWLDQDIKCFDTSLFNITPAEAEAMDPQQRLLLEVVFEAMETAGFPLTRYSGKKVGVYSGCMTQDYETLSARDELATSKYFATGNSRAIMANRISYYFNFVGPSMTVDTACSSSLVALNLAILALRAGDCTMACVTGANLMFTPEQFIVESALHMLSPSGKCHMWDIGADGYARGEGFAVILIKPLSRAIADGDHIEGIIREVATNADGRTNGITMPNPTAQAALIRTTYARAGLDPTNPSDRCQYFEAHGTGTAAGDPREAEAIHGAFFTDPDTGADVEQHTVDGDKLLVGSIKTVIGHTEAAAGLAGLLKVVWSMKNGIVPPNLHFNTLNPNVEPFYKHLQIPTSSKPWPAPAPGQPRRASVNSFGFGGANAHVIVEEYVPEIHGDGFKSQPQRQSGSATSESGDTAQPQANPNCDIVLPLPIVISAASVKSLRDVILSYRRYLEQNDATHIYDLSWHQYARRTTLAYRVAFSATTRSNAIRELDSLLQGSTVPKERIIRAKPAKSTLRILGIFTGQGAQWATMSKTLLKQNPVYRDTIERLDAVLKTCPHPCSWTLADELMAGTDSSRMREAAISQPLCTAVQIALVDLMRSIGIDFHTVVGHSSGEIAAAYAAGKLSAEDAIVISYYRGMVAHLAGGSDGQKGAMMAVEMSESEAQSFCDDPLFGGRICIAASNAPKSVTLSGDLDVINLANKQLQEKSEFSRVLFVDTAYHSSHMTRPAVAYIQAMREYGVSPLPEGNKTIWVSSVAGRPRTGAQDLDCQYWADNMVNQVQFHEAVKHAMSDSDNPFDCVVEIGPHPALRSPTTQTAGDLHRAILYASPLSRPKDSGLSLADFIGFIWSNFDSVHVDLRHYIQQSQMGSSLNTRLYNIPRYPLDHSVRHWRESRISRQYHFKTDAPHELLGTRSRDDHDHDMRWRNILKLDKVPWLKDHSFQGQALLPASAYCVMALDAARLYLAGRPASLIELRDVEIFSGIPIDADSPGVETLFSLNVLRNAKDHTTIDATFSLYSCPADGMARLKNHATGSVHIVLEEPSMDVLPERNASLCETLPADNEAFYKMMSTIGLTYTGPFKALKSIRRRYGYCTASVDRFHPEESTVLGISPATLDACFQCAFLSYASPGDGSLWAPFLPTRIGRMQFNLAAIDGKTQADSEEDVLTVDTHTTRPTSSSEASKASISVDIAIFNKAGQTEVQVEELTVHALANTTAKDDLELYLHTVFDIDPTDEIVVFQQGVPENDDDMLADHCRRIASFCLENRAPEDIDSDTTLNIWSGETQDSVDSMIRHSNHGDYLEAVMSMGKLDPTRLSDVLPSILEEARQVTAFRNHVGRILKQIAHRYPSMDILCLDVDLTRSILLALDDSFQSFTIGIDQAANSSSASQNAAMAYSERVRTQNLSLVEKLGDQIEPDVLLDLVLLPTTLLQNEKATDILSHIREVMKPGGFLVLVSPHPTIVEDSTLSTRGQNGPPTPPLWPDIPSSLGFIQQARNSNQSCEAGYVLVRRFQPPTQSKISPELEKAISHQLLLVRGPSEKGGDLLVPGLQAQLSCSYDHVVSRSLDEVTAQELKDSTAIIVLTDLDEPLMPNMTRHRMNQLRALLQPAMTVLWVTSDAWSGNPDHAASFGFLRTIAAEVPTLNLQMLDLDPRQIEPQAETIASAFSQLVSFEKGSNGNLLHAIEPEIRMNRGNRLIPRVIPWKPANDRVNALRRPITKPVDTLRQCTDVILHLASNHSLRFEFKDGEQNVFDITPGEVAIQVECSSALPCKLSQGVSGYVCIGRESKTGVRMIALSSKNSSLISCPSSQTFSVHEEACPSLMILHQLIRYLASLTIVSSTSLTRQVVLVDPDMEFAMCLADVMASNDLTDRTILVLQTVPDKAADWSRCTNIPDSLRLHYLHPRTTLKGLKEVVPKDSCVFNFYPDDKKLSQRIAAVISGNGDYYSGFDMFNSESVLQSGEFLSIETIWRSSLDLVMGGTLKNPRAPEPTGILSLNELQQQLQAVQQFQIIDWKKEREVLQRVHHLVDERILSPNKTYLMFGMTRDSGHSLCRLLLDQGAKNVVLASRNPDKSPNWVNELRHTYQADVRIERADVTSFESVAMLKESVTRDMPPIGGVINGAMVLEDRVFDQMTVERWNRVLRPKTVGSSNLDLLFDDEDLEFFIMTSSFAAIGGHPGQSNYAAANMYMNGLAANRRRRGLPGFALNIGVVYGVGFLQREKDHLYAGLEREGYLPISEHSLHHMLIEAIAAGRPNNDDFTISGTLPLCALTTGLRRFQRGIPDPLHWHLDPRFGHFTLRKTVEDGPTSSEVRQSLQDELAGLDQKEDMVAAIGTALDQRLQIILQLPEGSIDHKNSMTSMGVDSLAAVEVRNWLQRSLGKDVPVMKLLDIPSIEYLCTDLAEQILADRAKLLEPKSEE